MDPSISLFALLLSNDDYPKALLCFYLTQYWLSHFSTHQLKTSLPLWCCICAVLITKSRPELGGWTFTHFLVFVNNPNSNCCPILGTGVISAHLCYCFTGQSGQGKASPRSWIATLYILDFQYILYKYQLGVVSPGRNISTISAFFLPKQVAWLRISPLCILLFYRVNCQDTTKSYG